MAPQATAQDSLFDNTIANSGSGVGSAQSSSARAGSSSSRAFIGERASSSSDSPRVSDASTLLASRLNKYVAEIQANFAHMLDALAGAGDPDAEKRDGICFEAMQEAFETLEPVIKQKTYLDALFAHHAHKADAGRLVGSTKTSQYLIKQLAITPAQVKSRLDLGAEHFGEPEAPAEDPSTNGAEELSEEEKEKKKKDEEERIKRRRDAQDSNRKSQKNNPQSDRVMEMIQKLIKRLRSYASLTSHELMSEALQEATTRSFDDLKQWLQGRVNALNAAADNQASANARQKARDDRYLSFAKPDERGGVRISGYVDAARAALLKGVIGTGSSKHSEDNAVAGGKKNDTRTLGQRRVDALTELCKKYDVDYQKRSGGIGSIVISVSAEELDNIDSNSLFSTTTGDTLTPLDLLLLGAAKYDFLSVNDVSKSLPLALGKAKRTSSLYQKLALAVSELVCSHPDCSRYLWECDVHHIDSWLHGGNTDIDNLTLLCRNHHMDNNDFHNGANNMGHAERDPDTGRVGHRYADGSFATNNSYAASQATMHKQRKDAGYPQSPPPLKAPPTPQGRARSGIHRNHHNHWAAGPPPESPPF